MNLSAVCSIASTCIALCRPLPNALGNDTYIICGEGVAYTRKNMQPKVGCVCVCVNVNGVAPNAIL